MEENKNVENQDNNNPTGNPNTPPPVTSKGKTARKPEPKEKTKSAAGTVIMLIVIIGLMGMVGFLFFRDNEKTKVIKAQVQRINEDSIQIARATKDLEETRLLLERMKMDAAEMEQSYKDSLQDKITQVDKLIYQLRVAKSYKKYKTQALQLQDRVNNMDLELSKIIAERDSARALVASLTSEGIILKDTISHMTEERTELQEKIALASILRGEEFSVIGLSAKGKEYTEGPLKSKQLDKLKLKFSLAENKVARKNEKEVIMRLIEPDGTVLFSGVDGGSFTSTDGEEKLYTLSQPVAFEGSKKPITFIYQKGNEYKSGKHVIEIYAEGHKIGETSFQVK